MRKYIVKGEIPSTCAAFPVKVDIYLYAVDDRDAWDQAFRMVQSNTYRITDVREYA
jgi:hypothetical protein